MRRTGLCAGVVDVKPLIWWEEDMASRDEQDLLAVATFGEVETSGQREVWPGQRWRARAQE
jgi:hypothetical protein